MPTTRSRSTRSSTGAGGKQSTLSFKHKVTKAIKTGKEGYKSPSRAKEYIPEPSPAPAGKDEEDDEVATDDELPLQQEQQQKVQPAAVTDVEAKARKITDRAIERYWNGIEASRSARDVHKKHTEGLATGEKVLRYFDVSSQYGVRNILSTTHPPNDADMHVV
jgi:DNA polymerase delta subunit 4